MSRRVPKPIAAGAEPIHSWVKREALRAVPMPSPMQRFLITNKEDSFMLKRFSLTMALGVILSTAFAGAAQAITVSFNVRPNFVKVGEPVILTDKTVSPSGQTLTHAWNVFDNSAEGLPTARVIEAGNSACLNPDCSQVQLTRTEPGEYNVDETVGIPNGYLNESENEENHGFVVYDPAHPPPFTLASPTTVSLPAVLEVLSPENHVNIYCSEPAWERTYWQYCAPYLLSQTGPDNQDQYHFRFKVPVGYPGQMELWVESPPKAASAIHTAEFLLNVTSSTEQFGDVQSCYEGKGAYSFSYYDTTSSSLALKLQVLRNGKWRTRKKKLASFPVAGAVGLARILQQAARSESACQPLA